MRELKFIRRDTEADLKNALLIKKVYIYLQIKYTPLSDPIVGLQVVERWW